MEFAEQERRREQIVIPEYQSFPAEGSEDTAKTLGNGVDYSKVPKALRNTPIFGIRSASSQESAQGQSNADAPVAKADERSDSAPLGGAITPPILIAGGLGGALPAPSSGLAETAAKGLRAVAPGLKGAARVGGRVFGGLGGIILEGVFAPPVGGEAEAEWMRRNAARQQVLKSQRGRQGDPGDTGIRREAQDLVDQGKAKNLEDALGQLMKEAKLPNGKADTKRQQRIKKEQKARKIRGSRETKDIKDNPDPDKPKSNKKK